MSPELQTLISAVHQSRTKLLRAASSVTDAQGAFKPSPAEWSIAENIEHLFQAELGGITKIWAALNDARAGKRWTDPLPHMGKPIDQVIAETWKEKENVPPVAVPHIGGPLSAWTAALRSLQPLLHELGMAMEGKNLGEIVFPHALSGPLDARQRLEFLRFHIDRHAAQIERVRSHPTFPT